MNFVVFDLEITKPLPEGDDWHKARPLGISCAATLDSEGDLKLWHGAHGHGLREFDLPYPPSMNPKEAGKLLAYLESFGENVVTWNGLGFDFLVLADESGELERCRRLATNHIDIAFAMFCHKGFMVGLDAAASGMRVKGKMKEVGGAAAPEMWARSREAQELVLRYVAQDVQATMDVYQAILSRKVLTWTTKRRTSAHWLPELPLPDTLHVSQALQASLPDQTWMSNPWPREKFSGWLTP